MITLYTPTLTETIRSALTPQFIIVLLLTAIYLVTICTKDARRKNHQNAAAAARLGGWLYALLAAATLVINLI